MHQPGSRVLEHLGLDERVLDQPDHAGRKVDERSGRPGDGEDPQVAGHRQGEEDGGAPEQREDERVGRDVGERLEHQLGRLSLDDRRGTVIVRPGERLEGVIEHRLDRLERFQRALRAAGQVDDERTVADADDAARQVGHRRDRSPGRAHRLGQPGDLVVDHGGGRLRGDVARRQAGATGRHDQRMVARAVDQGTLDRGPVVGHDPALDREPERRRVARRRGRRTRPRGRRPPHRRWR